MATVTRKELGELRQALRTVLRGLWRRRRPTAELLDLVGGDPPLSPRHVSVLAHVGGEGPRTVGEIARELGLTLPAASKLIRDLEEHTLVRRSEDPEDRRRTMVDLNALTS
jgi:DNA-binding MarR family transcriptional regulator